MTTAVFLLTALLSFSADACESQRHTETRYWAEPGKPEARRSSVLRAFKRAHPCPANGARAGPCEGWVMDHVIPLACGGADAVVNLQWLPVAMWREKNKWERQIYLSPDHAPAVYCYSKMQEENP